MIEYELVMWMGWGIIFFNKKILDQNRRAANEGFESREMSNIFRTGLIKLIPKKGEWRPISLLCCGYKITITIIKTCLISQLNYIGCFLGAGGYNEHHAAANQRFCEKKLTGCY